MSKDIFLLYTDSAIKDLDGIDKNISKRITQKIGLYTRHNPLLNATSLKGNLSGLYRYRIGDYRAIFKYEEDKLIIVNIISIKHRKDAYR
jgi:mRNA interferase RelE/StbE